MLGVMPDSILTLFMWSLATWLPKLWLNMIPRTLAIYIVDATTARLQCTPLSCRVILLQCLVISNFMVSTFAWCHPCSCSEIVIRFTTDLFGTRRDKIFDASDPILQDITGEKRAEKTALF
jgi:hypothetical protein